MILHLTSKCNLACAFCFAKPTTDIGLEEWKQICQKSNSRTFHFSGGEPFAVWDEITKPLIEYIQNELYPQQHSEIDISTNGTLITDEIAEYCKNRNVVIWVSLHGNRDHMEAINQGSYDRVIAGLDILKAHNVPIHIRMTATKDNFDQIPFIQELALSYGSKFSVIQRCFGSGLPISLTEEQINQAVANKDSLHPMCLNSTWDNVRPCLAPSPAIKPDGSVIPCSAQWNTILGNALTEDMNVILGRYNTSMEFGCRRNDA
jgi:sulfatase maturation enzyme AslB (radical SAM superfamily)